MPDDSQEDDFQLTPPIGSEPVVLPPVSPPATKTPFQLNQQINIQQIPPKAWDKLSPDQIVELSKVIVAQIEKSDERQYNEGVRLTVEGCSGGSHASYANFSSRVVD